MKDERHFAVGPCRGRYDARPVGIDDVDAMMPNQGRDDASLFPKLQREPERVGRRLRHRMKWATRKYRERRAMWPQLLPQRTFGQRRVRIPPALGESFRSFEESVLRTPEFAVLIKQQDSHGPLARRARLG